VFSEDEANKVLSLVLAADEVGPISFRAHEAALHAFLQTSTGSAQERAAAVAAAVRLAVASLEEDLKLSGVSCSDQRPQSQMSDAGHTMSGTFSSAAALGSTPPPPTEVCWACNTLLKLEVCWAQSSV